MNRCTEAIVDIHGIKWYYPEICVDGGVFRPKNTYTNLTFPSGSFKHTISGITYYDPMPYSGHFYGIRKYTGLAPNLPYVVNITGKTGQGQAIDIPTEVIEIEYNKNENYGNTTDYTGFRLNGNIQISGEFGKSVASKDDLLAIGCPKASISSGDVTYEEAGVVFLYRRNPRPTTIDWPLNNYKSNWTLEKALTLPSGLLGDYSIKQPIRITGLPENFQGVETTWFVGQDGRQFGHSVDVSINKKNKSLGEQDQEIVVVGGVGAKWNRTFDDYNPSPVSIGIMIFTDEFSPRVPSSTNPRTSISHENILHTILNKDAVFNYFSNPSVKFDLKVIVCVPTANIDAPDPIYPDKPSFITLKRISKNVGFPVSEENIATTLSGIKASFLEAFPYSGDLLNSGIPPILGICVDDSYSLGGRESLEPALDQFIDFYKEYSFASGLKDFYGVRCSGVVNEYLSEDGRDANWVEMSQFVIDEVLDTGNLLQNDQVRFFSSNVGTFYENRGDFNIPPDSGGKVYIFEKESGSWNLIQEIRSPNFTREYHDRFGHSVSISDDGEVIAVGSPYISDAVTIYERDYLARDYFYNDIILNWVRTQRPAKYEKLLKTLNEKPSISLNDKKSLYLALDPEDKFQARLENGIQEYKKIHTFNYSNMQPVGSWTFIPNEFAPTSRLGYSVDVNENGSVVVAGAPTDSMNFYNDADVYYALNASSFNVSYSDPSGGPLSGPINSSWSSSLYTGSAHVFESRKYYPHNKVIEYGKFGNLHENISANTADSGHFMYVSGIFRDKSFAKTDFDQPEIPMDAGLVFIITPAVQALSDEVFDNIKNWLALGDRNLVLVGNDPRWEASGIYSRSNEILNELLRRLNSRMRIVPARNEYESLPSGYVDFNNVVPSFVPYGSTSTYTKRLPLRGSGVADIKVFYPYDEVMKCDLVTLCDPDAEPTQIQTRCEMPLKNYGDLRAEWNEFCCKLTPKGFLPVIYKKNWPFVFGSYIPDCSDQTFDEQSPTKNQEPIPLLVAAEKLNQEVFYPEIPAVSGIEIQYETVEAGFGTIYQLGSPISDISNFSYSASGVEGVDYNFIAYNVTARTNSELFYKPSDDLGGVLQANGYANINVTPYTSKEVISDKGFFALEYPYPPSTTSRINIIPNLFIESQFSKGLNDENYLFYRNLISSSDTVFGQSNIAQLNWNGRSSFTDAYDRSELYNALLSYNNNVDLNVSTLNNEYNVAILPNINSQPSELQISNLTNWLARGNKRFIITCDNKLSSINEAKILCGKLQIRLELLKKSNGEYPIVPFGVLDINQNHRIGGQFFRRPRKLEYFFSESTNFYPFQLTNNAIPLAFTNEPIYEDVIKEDIDSSWDINAGIAQINVPVLAGSGYRLFINAESQSPIESNDLTIYVEDASSIANKPYPDIGTRDILELSNSDRSWDITKRINSNVITINCSSECFIDFQVGNVDNINIYVSCVKSRLTTSHQPKTVRLTGISGVLIPIYEQNVVSSIQIPVGFKNYRISDPVPERTETVEVIRTISTDNSKYCRTGCEFLGNQLIEDGPVVAAQELEILSNFDAGFARSRITILTDSSMIQGRYVLDQDGTLPRDTYEFIRSLYPETTFFSENYGRQFNVYNKLISPERGSPTKYHRQANYLGLNKHFGNSPDLPIAPINGDESNYIFKYVNRPELPWAEEPNEEKREEIKNLYISGFLSRQIQHSALSRISGVIDGQSYHDAPVYGGVPRILKDKGYDYLDFDKFPSGYIGDLFGYSVCTRGNNILIGSPMSAFGSEAITVWSEELPLYLAQDGGAGSVYMFDKSNNNKWSANKKFRPQSLMGQLSGINVYSDHFGHSIQMQNDIIIIGAPNHDYGNYYELTHDSGSFSTKNFTPQFDIVDRKVYDLAYSGIRNELSLTGYQKDAGAIYLYENKITDWENKRQSWILCDKIISDYTYPSGERFGKTIYLSRPYRSDSDYLIVAGCNLASGQFINVGATYTKDIMLKSQNPSLQNSGAWISAKVFGDRDIYGNPTVSLSFSNIGNSVRHYASGLVLTNANGEIFLEVSGQDPSTRGFISHRPYIESIYGYYQYGKLESVTMPLYTDCGHIPPSSQMPLIIDVENSSYVYNPLGLYSEVKTGDASSDPSGVGLFVEAPSGASVSYLNISTSGTGSRNDILNLSVRGK